MGSNNFDGPILLDSLALDRGYFGTGGRAVDESVGPRISGGAPADPNGLLIGPQGSLHLAAGTLWQNTDGAVAWAAVASGVGPITQIDTGETIWVDATFGNDGTGALDRQDLPFATIQAAVNLANAQVIPRPIVMIRPGQYTEDVRLINPDLHLVGYSAAQTAILGTGGANPTLDISNSDISVSNLTVISDGDVSAVLFSGIATLTSSSVKGCLLASASNLAPTVEITSVGTVTGAISNLSNCQIENRTGEAVLQSNGTSRFRNVYISDRSRIGVNIDRGTCLVEDSRFMSLLPSGLVIGVNGEVQVDPATRWSSLTNNGTLTYYETGISPQYTPAVSGDWVGADPIDVASALDRIANFLGPIA